MLWSLSSTPVTGPAAPSEPEESLWIRSLLTAGLTWGIVIRAGLVWGPYLFTTLDTVKKNIGNSAVNILNVIHKALQSWGHTYGLHPNVTQYLISIKWCNESSKINKSLNKNIFKRQDTHR